MAALLLKWQSCTTKDFKFSVLNSIGCWMLNKKICDKQKLQNCGRCRKFYRSITVKYQPASESRSMAPFLSVWALRDFRSGNSCRVSMPRAICWVTVTSTTANFTATTVHDPASAAYWNRSGFGSRLRTHSSVVAMTSFFTSEYLGGANKNLIT